MPDSAHARVSSAKLALAVRRLRVEKDSLDLIASDPIAIIGMGCRFPGGANSPDEFWEMLRMGRDGIREVPAGRWNDDAQLPQQIRRGGYVADIDRFDAAYFGISPREAQQMDPQQRLLLEVTWEALWDAGIEPASLAATDTGVFVAIYNSDYARLHFRDTSMLTAHGGIGTAHSVAAGRLSFLLNLKGPCLAVDSACSSSLVATHLACQGLRNRECGAAIVGASNLKLLSDEVIVFSKWGMLASDGKCKTFDAAADGFVPGEGSGVLILKRLSDALQDGDRVRAVIRGTAVNHDGKTTVLTAPNGLAQEAVLRAALRNAMLGPGDISYIETHGTGTSLGDPIETEAIRTVYGQARSSVPTCVLGAVKTNLGHLESAAGMAGIIKTVLCLEHGEIPRNLHFQKLNPEISLGGTRLKVATENIPWTRNENPRAAGISSFGLGGTNGHVIVEEAPLLPLQPVAQLARTIPLPAYKWKRERFWLGESAGIKKGVRELPRIPAAAAANGHPLLRAGLDSAFFKGKLFEVEIDSTVSNYLAEHRLDTRALLPFAAYLEIACAAMGQRDDARQNAIRDFVVREPLFLSSEPYRLQVLVGDDSVEIASTNQNGWTIHAKGSLLPMETESSDVDLKNLRARCRKEVAPDDLYRTLEETGLRYGAAFRTLRGLWVGERESVGHLHVSEEETTAAQRYGMHPTLLDGCLQAVVAARGDLDGNLFLPISVERFAIYRTGVPEVWVHTKIVADSGEAFSADLVMMDENGALVARIGGFQAKRASAAWLQQRPVSKPAPTYEVVWRPVTLQDSSTIGADSRAREGESWLLIESETGACSNLAQLLAQQGAKCEVLTGESSSLLSAMAERAWTGILYDARRREKYAEALDGTSPEKNDVEFVLELVRNLEASREKATPRLWIVSAAAAAVLPFEDVAVEQAPLWGLTRTLALEYPDTSPVLVDMGFPGVSSATRADHDRMLVEELGAHTSEAMVAFRNGGRYVARLVEGIYQSDGARRLQLGASGRLEDLRIEPAMRREPGPREVEIEVRASGLNFRDVLAALGMVPARKDTLGAECSGRIARVGSEVGDWKIGDDVLAFAPTGLQTFVNVPADFLARKPNEMTFADAAGIPVAFLTAWYGLHHLARLEAGQRVLIHAGAGGLGLAAVQLAMQAGTEVFATAGSEEKRAILQARGVKHTFDSRSLTFRDDVLRATQGAGVDVVLNSLAGEFVRASFDTVAKGGCFLEVGKRDIWTQEQVAALGKQVRYFPFDLGDVAERDPKAIAAMLRELMERFSAGVLQPLPTTLYSFEDSAHAFRTMAQARHIGKIVLGLQGGEDRSSVRELVSDGTVLVTGGLGALALKLAHWLAAEGAKHLVLAGRSAEDREDNPAIEHLRKQGVKVSIETVDVADQKQLHNCLDRIRAAHPPLRAIFHAAGVVRDSVLSKESWESYLQTTAPKIKGAWNLHRLTERDPIALMVFFSSAASVLGSSGQGSYAAGNAFLDSLAHHRASRGLTTLSVNWGAWASAGMAARLSQEQAARWARQGSKPMEPAAALAALQSAIETGRTQVVVMDMEWDQFLKTTPIRRDNSFLSELQRHAGEPTEKRLTTPVTRAGIVEELRSATEAERRFLLSAHIKICARRALGLQESAVIQDGVALQDVGLDSLMALEMRNDLSQSLGVALAAGLLFDHPSVEDLTRHLLGIVVPLLQPAAKLEVQEEATAADDDLKAMTDEQAELLLIQELDRSERRKVSV